ncbi:NAD(P)H-quinone oxidoreductase chain 4 1 [Botrimarina colliarenosi]|uniref:NAD(P)H-quinone oxidoreductase chain 4 1 n=1 Tax=Botrimarina colliarenosi TaxID=2528001 RepID=A0A5C6AEC3_9BACT|nr:proton-conducting transporter membrane subunit [Botrimarina colliarenosi]TWT97959.1 NAD(P)H-quinone oxidoreductase chain 4 1 [Botrimarina colliarenosi]
MNELHLPLIEIAVFAPLLGALLARQAGPDTARRCALIASGAALGCSVAVWIDLALVHAFEAHDRWALLSWLPGGDPFVIDEVSAPLLPLAALQFLLTFVATLRASAARFSFALSLIGESLVLATLATKSPWLITALMAAAAVPVAIQLKRRGASTRVFTLHMTLFIALLTAGVALKEWGGAEGTAAVAGTVAIALAVLIRCAATPFHLWLVDLFDRVSFGAAILFVTPMTGAYVALRLLLPDAPEAVLRGVAVVSLVTAVYAAAMALVQRDARRVFAYLLLSHASLVLVGLEIATLLGLTGALCVWLSVGLAMTGFGLTLRCVETRVGRIDVDRFNGLHDASPTLAGLFLLTGLASIGFPGTVGFIAVELLVEGAVQSAPVIGVVVLIATALNGVAVLRAYFRIFTGCEHASTIDLGIRPSERIAVLVLSVLILGGGLWPQPGVASRRHAAAELLRQRAAVSAAPLANSPPSPSPLDPTLRSAFAANDHE